MYAFVKLSVYLFLIFMHMWALQKFQIKLFLDNNSTNVYTSFFDVISH